MKVIGVSGEVGAERVKRKQMIPCGARLRKQKDKEEVTVMFCFHTEPFASQIAIRSHLLNQKCEDDGYLFLFVCLFVFIVK